MSRLRDYGAEVEQSFQGFTSGGIRVSMHFGFSEGGDWLRFLIVRGWSAAATPEERAADPRVDGNSGGRPRVRHPDGTMRPVGTDGHVYLFVGDEVRTMRVATDEHSVPSGLSRADGLEGMWSYLQQFRVTGEGVRRRSRTRWCVVKGSFLTPSPGRTGCGS